MTLSAAAIGAAQVPVQLPPDTNGETILANVRALRPAIVAARDEIEQGRRLPQHLAEALRQAGVYRLAMPRAWGGAEADPFVQFKVLEELVLADASVAWCAAIGFAAGGYFTALLDQDVARALFPSVDLITAGANRPQGRAVKAPGGYHVSGRWSFGSGCQNADRMLGGCLIFDDDGPLKDAKGRPASRICYLPLEAVTVLDTWTSTGLRGSGSHDYTVTDVFVPAEHTFDRYFEEPVRRPGTLYAFPTLFLVVHAPMATGLGLAAIAAVKELAQGKSTMFGTGLRDEAYVQTAVARAEALVGSARSYMLDILGDIWQTLLAGDPLSSDQQARFRLAITHTHTACVEAVQLMYHTAGGTSSYASSPLDRYLRDINTINQHIVVGPKSYEAAGRMLLGLEPG
jgi:indole-3-acetate monooxygenase